MAETLTHTPADILRWLFIKLSAGTDPGDGSNWPIYAAVELDSPDNLIVTVDTTGIIQGWEQPDGDAIEQHGVQIVIRDKDYNTAYRKAITIRDLVDNTIRNSEVTTPAKTTAQAYTVHSIRRVSGPIPLNTEGSKRNRFTINVLVRLTQQ